MPHLLFLEQDADLRSGVDQQLRREGFTLSVCSTGREALRLLEAGGPRLDLAVLDLHPPDMDGLDLLRALRARTDRSGLPILLLSARPEDIDRVLDAGLRAEDYVSRPYGTRELAARIKAILRRAEAGLRPPPDATPAFGPVSLDPAQRQAYLAGAPMDLTRKEYELLAHFVANPHRVLSRERLLHDVWGLDYLGESRTIDAHVRRLRAKLGCEANLIETVVGVGYRMGPADT